MQTLTRQEEGACFEVELSGRQPLLICRTGSLNPPVEIHSRRNRPARFPAGEVQRQDRVRVEDSVLKPSSLSLIMFMENRFA